MKTLITYCSRYGSTQQYAQWIQESVESDLICLDNLSKDHLGAYSTVVFGSPVYAQKILAAPYIHNHWKTLQSKQIILFVVSGTPPEYSTIAKPYFQTFSQPMREKMIYFPLHGRLDWKKLNGYDKCLLTLQSYLEKDPKRKRQIRQGFDGVRQETIQPIVSCLQVLNCTLTGVGETR